MGDSSSSSEVLLDEIGNHFNQFPSNIGVMSFLFVVCNDNFASQSLHSGYPDSSGEFNLPPPIIRRFTQISM